MRTIDPKAPLVSVGFVAARIIDILCPAGDATRESLEY
jgi:hypothetical protein